MKRINALLFDLGGVIVDLDYNKTIKAFEAIGLEDAENLYNQFNQSKIVSNQLFLSLFGQSIPSQQ